MNSKWHVSGDYFVEIWFRIEKDKGGYPESKSWEQLLAKPLVEDEECFQIESIPFFLKNVSRGDIVRARASKNDAVHPREFFEFVETMDRGGHNTYRLLLRKKSANDPSNTEKELIGKGLAVEIEHDDFLAVDVPPSIDQNLIDAFLAREEGAGRWEIQDGCLQSIRTT